MAHNILSCGLFKFHLPEGWNSYISGNDVGLAAEDFPAWIWIYPHQLKTMQEVQANLEHVSKHQDLELTLEGNAKRIGKNAVAINFGGIIKGAWSKGRAIGTLVPGHGGVFIFAATNSDKFFDEISSTADAIAREVWCHEIH